MHLWQMDYPAGTSSGSSSSPAVVLTTSNMSVSSPVEVSIPSPALQLNIQLLEAAVASEGARLLIGINPLSSSVIDRPLITRGWPISSVGAPMDERLLNAATSGDGALMKRLALRDPSILLPTNPQGNTCLHIASMYGHKSFCTDTIALNRSLLAEVNMDGETPLLVAVTSGHVDLASVLLSRCHEWQLSSAISKQDKHGCNVLHHAIRCGHTKLALDLTEADPALSLAVNCDNESPMFIAARRDFMDVFEKLLNTPGSADCGAWGYNVLHAAVCNDNQGESLLEYFGCRNSNVSNFFFWAKQ